MKYLVSISIILILIFQSGVNTFFLFNYHRSLARYEALCVNKDKPEMKCHGKCKMMEETKRFGFLESEDEKQPNAPHLKSIKSLDLFYSAQKESRWSVNQIDPISVWRYVHPFHSVSINIPHPPPEKG